MKIQIKKANINKIIESLSGTIAPLQVLSRRVCSGKMSAEFGIDAHIIIGWRQKQTRFAVGMKSRTAPGVVQNGIWNLKSFPREPNEELLLLVPFLSEKIVAMLETAGINGIDTNGNYYIQTGNFLAIRLDRKNTYKESTSIKKVFEGKSALVGRLLLRENRRYQQVSDIHREIKNSGAEISLATVSKVLKVLENELILKKGNDGIWLLQARELLRELGSNYKPPVPSYRLNLKLPESRNQMEEILNRTLGRLNWIWSGESSADHYTTTTETRQLTCYTKDIGGALKALKSYENSRFYNCTVIETAEESAYFNNNAPWSSRLQCFLELSNMDKREKEIAMEIETKIISLFEDSGMPDATSPVD